jgi:endonuclease/exonuclease/phosphatase family metal-dependent hydrolase
MRALSRVLALSGGALMACMPSHRMTPDPVPERSCPDVAEQAWYFPETAGDHARLEDWCRTVGPPVVSPDPTAAFGDLESGGELEVISWNVDVGGGDVLGFLETELGLTCEGNLSRLAPGAAHFALLMQEAFRRSNEIPEHPSGPTIPKTVAEDERPGERLDAVEVAARCGLSLVYVAAARNGAEPRDGMREDKGVAILSTLRLENVFFIELPYEAARRVASVATVSDASGRRLRLANLHLISTAGPSRALATGNGSRLRQGLAVADALDVEEASRSGARGSDNGPAMATLLAGDFNTWSDRETTLRRLREQFPDSPPALGEGTHGAFPTDHVLFRAGSEGVALAEGSYVRFEDDYRSDHHPIRVRVRFGD